VSHLRLEIESEGSDRVEVDRFDNLVDEEPTIFLEVYDILQSGRVRSACVELTRKEARKIGRALRKAGKR
jgi:hypothetical protein